MPAWVASFALLGLGVGAAVTFVITLYVPDLTRRIAVLAVLGTGALFAIATARFAVTWQLPAYLYFAGLSIALAVIDAQTQRLPNPLTLTAYPILFALFLLPAVLDDAHDQLLQAIVGGLVLLGLFFVLYLVYPAGIGFGDVKLAGSMGMALGWVSWSAALWGACAGFLIAAAVSIVLLASHRTTRKSQLAFGPSMLLGAWLVLVASGRLPV